MYVISQLHTRTTLPFCNACITYTLDPMYMYMHLVPLTFDTILRCSLRPSDELEIEPRSSNLLFVPAQRRFSVSEGSDKVPIPLHVYVHVYIQSTLWPITIMFTNCPFCTCLCMCSVCPERVPLFEGSPGVILSGNVGPAPLEGVSISVLLEGGEVIHTVTDRQGQYRWVGTLLV